MEDGETPASALVRELAEELGIDVQPPDWEPSLAVNVGADTHITVWAVDRWIGDVANCAPEEHDSIDWFRPSDLKSLELADPAIADLCAGAVRDQ